MICSLLIWQSTRIEILFSYPLSYALVIKNNNGSSLKRATILFSLLMAECFKQRVLIKLGVFFLLFVIVVDAPVQFVGILSTLL